MTWTRIATAVVLIPAVVALVLFTPTYVVAIATGLVTILALREYFALGDAIGHRAYRLWTIFCSLCLILWQALAPAFAFPDRGSISGIQGALPNSPYSYLLDLLANLEPQTIFFLFVLGLTVITLFTRRALVETLPSAGISSSALLLVAFPLSYAVSLHGFYPQGPLLLLFALCITWAADTTAYFVGRAVGKHALAPHISPKKTWEGSVGSMFGSLAVAFVFHYW